MSTVPTPQAPKPLTIALRKDLLIDKMNHPRGSIVEVDRNRAKRLIEEKAAYRVGLAGEIIPDVDADGVDLPVDDLEGDEA